MTDDRKRDSSLLSIGTAACVACCAGPILAFLGGIGLAGAASTALVGTAGLAITVAAVVGDAFVRARSTTCRTSVEPMPVEAPRQRPAPTRRGAPR